MAIIRPFRAFRYNEEKIRDINKKFSPLFDVVSNEQREALYDIPNNSIHLNVPRSLEDAVAKKAEWTMNGIIRQDPIPGIYIYYQTFSIFGEQRNFTRKGFISMMRLSPPGQLDHPELVLHEDTITSSVAERTRLLEATKLNVSPTHGLYDDPEFQLEQLMDAYMEHPLYEYIDYQGVMNKLAIVQNKHDLELFRKALGDKKVYLADGHHRLASSIYFRDQRVEAGADPEGDEMFNYHLIYLTNLRSDDLRILPIHRVVHTPGKRYSAEDLINKLNAFFYIKEVTQQRKPVYENVNASARSLGMVIGPKQFLLTLKPGIDPVRDIELEVPDAVKKLDYTILHYFILDKVLGLPYEDQPKGSEISYQKDYSAAVKAAMESDETLAFITPGLSMEDMMEVCDVGALMPQKSTYFYPKVVCGLLFASIDDVENNSSFDTFFRISQEA